MIERILITGATGFIGRHVLRHVRQAGYEVEAISRRGGSVDGTEVHSLDLADDTRVQQWVASRKFAAILHLASDIPDNVHGPSGERALGINLASTHNMLRLARDQRCLFVYTSSSSIYGLLAARTAPVTEAEPPNPQNLYSFSKYAGEILCRQFAEQHGISCSILRVSAPYGPGANRRTVINLFLESALRAGEITLLGTGARSQDFTFVDDVARAIILAMEHKITGTFNIAGGSPVSMRQLAEEVLRAVPSSASAIRCLDRADPEENSRPWYAIDRARDELGWTPRIDLAEGLRRTAASLCEE